MSASSSKSSLFITLRPWLISAVALLALVLLVQQLAKPSGPERPERGPRGAVSEDFLVSASAVERVDLPVHYNALGTVTAFNTVVVRSRIDGELVKVLFEEGQRVKAGDLLAVIDPRSYRAALDEAEGTLQQNQAQLRNAEIDLQRYQDLLAQDSIARQTLELARENLTLAKKRYETGAYDVLEFNEAQRSLTKTQNELVVSYYGYLTSLAALDYAIGN